MRSERHSKDQSRAIWPPEAGFFRVQLSSRAWAVPCAIVAHDDGTWQAVVDGVDRTPHADPAYAQDIALIWTSGTKIAKPEYDYLNAIREHYRAHGPEDHPSLHPREAINPMRLRPIFPERRRTP